MQPLTVNHPVGTHVLYTGRPDVGPVTGASVDRGSVLGELHPGKVVDVDVREGVRVEFLGLEREPLASARFAADASGAVPGLVAVAGSEWLEASDHGWWSALVV